MAKINAVFKIQIVIVQTSYEYYANIHKKKVPNYILSDEMWLNTRNIQTKPPSKKLFNKFDGFFYHQNNQPPCL